MPDDWAQRLTGGAARPAPPARPMPERVRDGVVSEVASRPAWVVVGADGLPAPAVAGVLSVLAAHGKEVVPLDDVLAGARASADVAVLAVHDGAVDRAREVASQLGARLVLVGRQPPRRREVAVGHVEDLSDLLAARPGPTIASTYHEL